MLAIGFSTRTFVVVALGSGFAIAGNMIALAMLDQINRKLPKNKQLSYFRWGLEIRKIHRTMYPERKLALLFDICIIMVILCFFALIWSMGILLRKWHNFGSSNSGVGG